MSRRKQAKPRLWKREWTRIYSILWYCTVNKVSSHRNLIKGMRFEGPMKDISSYAKTSSRSDVP